MAFGAGNLIQESLSQAVTDTDTELQFTDVTSFTGVDTPFVISVYKGQNPIQAKKDGEHEIMTVTAVDDANNTLTVERGQEGTTAIAFDVEDTVDVVFSAGIYDEIRNDIANASSAGGYDDSQLRTNINELVDAVAGTQFELNLSQLEYTGGFYDSFIDSSKIDTTNDITRSSDNNLIRISSGTGVFSESSDSPLPITISYDVDITKDFSLLATASNDGSVRVYDTSNWNVIESKDSWSNANPNRVKFNRDGTLLAVGLSNNDLTYVYETDTWTEVTIINLGYDDRAIQSLEFSRDNTLLAIGGGGRARIYNVSDWSLHVQLDTMTTTSAFGVTSLSFNHDDSRIALGWDFQISNDGRFQVCDVTTGDEIDRVVFNDNRIGRQVAYNHDGSLIAVAGWASDRPSYIYNATTFSQVETITSENIRYVIFNEDGTKLFTAIGADINIFETDTWTVDQSLSGSASSYAIRLNEAETVIITGEGKYTSPVPSSGTMTSINKDLSEDGISSPTDVVLTQDEVLPNGATLTYKIIDGDNNEVSISQSEVGDVVDISTFTSNLIKTEIYMERNSTDETPQLKSYAIHVK